MKSKDPSPLKISLHGMSDRSQKMMASYLRLVCGDIATLVADEEAEAEIIDVDCPEANNLLKKRLAQRPSKPIIAISLHEVSSTEVIFVKKPLVVSIFIHALLTVKHMIQSNTALKKTIDHNRLTGKSASKTIKPTRQNTQSKTKKMGNLDRLSATRKAKADKKKIAQEATKLLNQITMIDNISNTKDVSNNRRKTVRYIFEGVEGNLELKSLIGRSSVAIQIFDISSKGANVLCNQQLKLRTKAALTLQFSSEQNFTIGTRVIRKNKNSYALAFEKHHHELIDFLVDSTNPYNIV